MYTIKQAATRTGVPVPLLRAWERRYGIVDPRRSPSGYRLYDDASIARLRSMRTLVDSGWTPSSAAEAILAGTAPATAPDERVVATAGGPPTTSPLAPSSGDLIGEFVEAAVAVDAARVEAALDRMFARGSFEVVAEELLLPALTALGDAWADARLTVAGEHAASHAVLRRLGAAFQAAGLPAAATDVILVGLPPGSRHELGALVFAVAARRAGLPVLYLGPDLPVTDWVTTVHQAGALAVVIASPTADDVDSAVEVGEAVRSHGDVAIAFGGHGARAAATRLGATSGQVIALPEGITAAVEVLSAALKGRQPVA